MDKLDIFRGQSWFIEVNSKCYLCIDSFEITIRPKCRKCVWKIMREKQIRCAGTKNHFISLESSTSLEFLDKNLKCWCKINEIPFGMEDLKKRRSKNVLDQQKYIFCISNAGPLCDLPSVKLTEKPWNRSKVHVICFQIDCSRFFFVSLESKLVVRGPIC